MNTATCPTSLLSRLKSSYRHRAGRGLKSVLLVALLVLVFGLFGGYAATTVSGANASQWQQLLNQLKQSFKLDVVTVVPQGRRTSVVSAPTAGTISLTALGTPYSQDFNTLASTGTSTTVPTGWDFIETGTNLNTTYTAGTGSSNAGDTYSFGASASTERALGGLQSGNLVPTIGASFTNNTGGAVTSLNVSYTGEQWRLGTLARTDRLDFQSSTDATSLTTGTWTDVNALDFVAPTTGSVVGALDGNAAANRTAISNTITGLSIPNSAVVWIRWIDLNATSSDDGLAVDDFSLTPLGSGALPNLTINNVAVTEGDGGTVTASFTVNLSVPALAGGVTFDIATADDTAMTSNNDYVLKSLTGQTIPAGSSTYTFDVTVNGDTTVEPNETFFVNVTMVVGATLGDGQGVGTITNDDVVITLIHDIQGSGLTSPLASQAVTTRGIVTGRRSNGYFIQEPDALADANPNTSEGIFVFTSSAPPATAALGNLVQVGGTVFEFIPSQDLLSPPLTELSGSPTTSVISTGNPLPAPYLLTAAHTPTSGTIEQLERLEGMRVQVNSLTVVAPTQGIVAESSATASSNGVFYGVITGIARPFREPGIEANDPVPAGSGVTIPPVPRFDANPERLRVDSDGQTGGTALEVTAGATVTNLVGPLDYSFRTYTILPDPGSMPVVSGNISFTAVPAPSSNQFTVASFNMQRFFDTTNDPGTSDAVLTATAFDNRLNKASLAIRYVLRSPDIIGVVEMENLSTLQTVATRVNNDAVASLQPNPMYQAYLVEGNDIGGIDVGFLVKSSRVTVIDVTQFGKTTTYIDPNSGMPDILNDRPPLVLRATVQSPFGVLFPVTVIVNHMRSLSSVDDPTDGNRVRTKRRAQAEFLANLIQTRQMADPNEKIISIGDYNAFQFNDGLGDSIGTVKGTPTAATMVTLASSDLVNPDLTDLIDSAAADQRYSYVFDGNAQALDHELISASLLPRFSQIVYARSNADFPETYRTDANRPERLSDHDAPVVYFTFPPCVLNCPGNIVTNTDPSQNSAIVTYPAPTATDCGVVTCDVPSGSAFAKGVTTVTCTAATGDMCAFTVTVNDNQDPVITCPLNVVRTIPGISEVVTFAPVATDNVAIASVACVPASGSSFNLGTTPVTCTATDTSNRMSTCGFTVMLTNSFVANPQIKLADPLACNGPGNVVGVTATIANPTAFPQTGSFSAALPPQLLALPNTCVTNIGSCSVVSPSTVSWMGTIPSGQTATISYQAQVGDPVTPGTQLCVTSTATFNGQPVSVVACNTVNCPTVGPGLVPDARSVVSDQKAGSVLFFNLHTSIASSPGTQNTRVNITNTHQSLSSFVHLFFVDGSNCSVADSFVCLTPNETTSFLASEHDPGTTGYIVAVAVDRGGCPVNFNYLIGDEYVKLASGHAANLGAEAFSALAGGLPFCNETSNTAVLAFDNVSYNAVPRVVALDNIQARADGNDTLLVLNRFGGNLGTGAATLTNIFGILYDDAEAGSSFGFSPGTCQFRSILSNNFPRTVPRLETIIPAGQTGWMKLFSTSDLGLLGSVINHNASSGATAGAFSQGHNLHKLRLTTTMTLTIPVFPPGC